jgi:hypothetical protein
MEAKYLIVLFKNKVRYKIIKKYQKYNNAINFFNQKLKENNSVIFNVATENGKDVKYEIAILEYKNKNKPTLFKVDEYGRNISIELENEEFSITNIEDYKIPEEIYDVKNQNKISIKKLLDSKLKTDNLKLISKLNNKIIIQNDDDYSLYSLKSIYDADRFLNSLQDYLITNNKKNCLIVKDTSSQQKKYLYEVLSNLGYNKKMLYRTSTTHLKDK